MELKRTTTCLPYILLLLFLFSAPCPAEELPPDITFEQLTVEDGLSHNTVMCFLRDSREFLWIGTEKGLNRYDGYNFRNYYHDPGNLAGLSHDRIRALIEDGHGDIWVGTRRGLCRYNRDTDSFTAYYANPGTPGGLVHDRIGGMTITPDNTLWVGTYGGGLHRWDGKAEKFISRRPEGIPLGQHYTDMIVDLTSSPNGAIWFGTDAHGLVRYSPSDGTYKQYLKELQVSRGRIGALKVTRSGTIWVCARSQGLLHFDPLSGHHTVYRDHPTDPRGLGNKDIYSILEDRDGITWIATIGGGLNLKYPASETFHPIPLKTGKGKNRHINLIMSLYQDSQDIIWIGTIGHGLFKYVPGTKKFNLYRENLENGGAHKSNEVYAIHEGPSADSLWLGTYGGGLAHLDRKTRRYTHYYPDGTERDSADDNVVLSIYVDEEKRLWLGTLSGGLKQFDTAARRFIHHPLRRKKRTREPSVIAIHEGINQKLWLGTLGSGLAAFDLQSGGTDFFPLPYSSSAINRLQRVHAIIPGSPGNILWLATSGGLFSFAPESSTFTRYLPAPQRPESEENMVICLLREPGGTIWAGTFKKGLNSFDPETGTFKAYGIKDGLPDDSVFGILRDQAGRLWFSTFKGLTRFDPAAGTFKNYSPADGLQSYDFTERASYQGRNGEMFFGGKYGFNAFHPETIVSNRHVPPVVITDFSLFYEPVGIGPDSPLSRDISETRTIRLTYRRNFFAFKFAALDFQDPARNRYAYRLEEVDRKWIHVSAGGRGATYTNVPPGTYVFRVKGSNNDGTWNETGTSIEIVITPPFWQRWWFKLLWILFLTVLMTVFYRFRIRKLSHKYSMEAKMEAFYAKYNISSREAEIIGLILAGKTNKQIENELYIAMGTVKTHIYNVFKKLNVKNRPQLIKVINTQKGTG